jgi:hypothetical protein
MCLKGIAWATADKRASEIVELARHRIGLSHFPSWIEARGPAPESREYHFCAGCGGHMPGHDRPWCSDECRLYLNCRQRRNVGRADDFAREQARRILLTGGANEVTTSKRSCWGCKKHFTPKVGHKEQRYCSRLCSSRREKYRPIACLVCASPFQAHQHKQLTCGPACAQEALRRKRRSQRVKRSYERPCAVCGAIFQARKCSYTTCGAECRAEAARRRAAAHYKARLREAPMAEAA